MGGFVNIIIILIAVALAGAGIYVVSVKQAPSIVTDETASTTTVTITVGEDEKVNVNTNTDPKTAPPVGQRFDTTVHDVKYFYDTVQTPKDGEVRSGYKNEVTIRGRLVVIKVAASCVTAPCPQPDPSQYGYELENAQEYIQNSRYRISFRETGDPIARSLKEGEIYVISGTLEHFFMNDDKVVFIFDPKKVQ